MPTEEAAKELVLAIMAEIRVEEWEKATGPVDHPAAEDMEDLPVENREAMAETTAGEEDLVLEAMAVETLEAEVTTVEAVGAILAEVEATMAVELILQVDMEIPVEVETLVSTLR